MADDAPDFGKLDLIQHSDEIAVKAPWGFAKVRTRDVLTLLPWLAILALLYLFGNEYLMIQRQALAKLADETAKQHAEILKTVQAMAEEQRVATYLSTLPPDKRPVLKMPKGLMDRLQEVP
jgi:uncharacterized membrane protein